MNIGLVIYGSLETATGGYLYDRQMAAFLREKGHEVVLFSLDPCPFPKRFSANLDIRFLARILQSGLHLLVEDELCHPSLFFLNRRLRQRADLPVVSVVHHLMSREKRPAWRNLFFAAVEKRYLDGVDGFIFNSRTTRLEVARMSPGRRPHVVARPAGNRMESHLTAAAVRDRALQPGPLRLLFVGMVTPRKGLVPLICALSRFSAFDWRLDVVGDPAVDPVYAERARTLAVSLEMKNRVRFRGFLPDAALSVKMAAAHVLCMPFAYEGFGIGMAEAMAHGLVVIGSTEGAAGEQVQNGRNGFLIPPGGAEVLLSRLRSLELDRERLSRMGIAALCDSKKAPLWRDSMERIHRFLSRMCEENRRKRSVS